MPGWGPEHESTQPYSPLEASQQRTLRAWCSRAGSDRRPGLQSQPCLCQGHAPGHNVPSEPPFAHLEQADDPHVTDRTAE